MVGGQALVEGVLDGVIGAVRMPYMGAVDGGLWGFTAGMGRGAVGVVAKPLSGAFNSIALALESIKNTTTYFDYARDRRLPRVVDPEGLLVPYDAGASRAQDLVARVAGGAGAVGTADTFEDVVWIQHDRDEAAVVFTAVRLISFRSSCTVLAFAVLYDDIAKVATSEPGRLVLRLRDDSVRRVPVADPSEVALLARKIEWRLAGAAAAASANAPGGQARLAVGDPRSWVPPEGVYVVSRRRVLFRIVRGDDGGGGGGGSRVRAFVPPALAALAREQWNRSESLEADAVELDDLHLKNIGRGRDLALSDVPHLLPPTGTVFRGRAVSYLSDDASVYVYEGPAAATTGGRPAVSPYSPDLSETSFETGSALLEGPGSATGVGRVRLVPPVEWHNYPVDYVVDDALFDLIGRGPPVDGTLVRSLLSLLEVWVIDGGRRRPLTEAEFAALGVERSDVVTLTIDEMDALEEAALW